MKFLAFQLGTYLFYSKYQKHFYLVWLGFDYQVTVYFFFMANTNAHRFALTRKWIYNHNGQNSSRIEQTNVKLKAYSMDDWFWLYVSQIFNQQ